MPALLRSGAKPLAGLQKGRGIGAQVSRLRIHVVEVTFSTQLQNDYRSNDAKETVACANQTRWTTVVPRGCRETTKALTGKWLQEQPPAPRTLQEPGTELSEGPAAAAEAEFEATPSYGEETRRLRSPRAGLLAPRSGHLRRRRCRRLGKFASAPAWGCTLGPRQGCWPSPPSCACRSPEAA